MSFLISFYKALTGRERVAFLAAAGGILLGLIGLAAIFFFAKTIAVPARGGTYVEGMVGQPAFVNPVIAKSSADKSLVRLLFASLPDLAEKIETADGSKTVKVRLKDNLVWSDGQEITSDDVIFTLDQMKDPDVNSPLAPAWQGITANRISKLEVDFKLPQAYVFFNDTLASFRPMPKHLYAEIPAANWKLSDYNVRPVGSGPYLFASRNVDTDGFISAYSLRANQSASAGAPLISTLDILFYRNPDELVKAFNSGSVEGFFAADPSLLQSVKRPYHPAVFPSPTYYAVFWNQSANAALAAPEVRRALELAVDRDTLTKDILNGAGSPSTDPLSPSFFPILTASSTSPDQAAALLDKNGWTIGTDGVRHKKSKKTDIPLEFNLSVPDVPFLSATAEELASDWQKIGIKANVESMPLESLLAGPIKNRTYEALLFGNTLTPSGDLFSFWHSTERIYPGLNLAIYQSKTADKLIETIRLESDPGKRMADMQDLRETIANDRPALFLYSPSATYVMANGIDGVEPGLITDPSDRFANVTKWYVSTRRALR